MTTTNQSLSVNGQALSNLDSDLVITLDDHPVVQISKIEESTITYSFLGDVEQETTYNLNLTFNYKGIRKLVVPMTFIHKPNVENGISSVTWDPSFAFTDASDNFIPITVTDQNGTPLEGVTMKSLSVSSIPVNNVINGWSNVLLPVSNGLPGEYQIRVTTSHLPGTVTIKMILNFNGIEFVVPDKEYTVPAGEFTITADPTIIVEGQPTDINLEVIQKQIGNPNHLFSGRITMIESTEDSITINSSVPILITNGKVVINVTGISSEVSTVVCMVEEYDSNLGVWRDAGEFNFLLDPYSVPRITESTADMTLNLWDTQAINYKVMLGDTDITSSVTNVVDQTDPNDAIELVKVDDTYWGFQAVKARTDEDLVIDAMVDVHVTYEGTEHVIPMTIDVVVKANTTGVPANRFNVEML